MPTINHANTLLKVADVSFRYQDQVVLDHISFDIHEGDYLGVIGPNGGGKTTLLKIMLGLLRPTNGTVTYVDRAAAGRESHPRIGYVPQRAAYIDGQFPATVREVVAMGRIGVRGLGRRSNSEDRRLIDEALAHVGMVETADRLIGELSGGQQQRVVIARALVGRPRLLFLDEPTAGVDADAQEHFYGLLNTLRDTLNLTLILVSHDIDVVASQATELACVNGRLVYHGSPRAFNASEHLKELYGKEIKFIVHDH
ncbi:MAG: metal ABC transporter ATP-binding protein [Candidatus Magasanikbacteria bacterium]|nr:metal ABC transporter ATP-binding protein [Candidatus Magasanikbacteria bacterium]